MEATVMVENALTPEQDLLTRRFFLEVASKDGLFPDAPAYSGQLRALLLSILNYRQLPNGNFVSRDTELHVPFGTNYADAMDAYPCEWDADTERAALKAVQENTDEQVTAEEAEVPESIENQFIAFDISHPGQASTSVEAESTEIREAVFPEDV
jgi:hypothetical protein